MMYCLVDVTISALSATYLLVLAHHIFCRMRSYLLLLCCLGACLLHAEAVSVTRDQSIKNEKPWFCHDLQCPDYVIQQTFDVEQEQLELRQYQGAPVSSSCMSATH